MSIDDSFVKLTKNGELNNLYLHLARDGHWHRKCLTVSSSSTKLYLRQKSLNGSLILFVCLNIMQWPVNTATVVYTTFRPRQCNWLRHLLSIKGQVSLAVEQVSSLTQDRLVSRRNLRLMSNLTKSSDIPNSIVEDSERTTQAVGSSSARQFPGMSLYPWTHNSEKSRTKVEIAAIFPNDPRVFHKTR